MNPAELVTGGHTGLTNPAMPTALARTGVTRIAGDASLNPAVQMLGQAIVVPRHPAPVYYNVGTNAEQLDEFNWIYQRPVRTRAAHVDQYVNLSADQMLSFVVANDPRPFFAHQANLADEGTFFSVGDAFLAKYSAWFSVPTVQPTMTDAGTLLMQLAGWQSALAAGQVTAYLQNGAVHITATALVSVPITGTSIGRGGTTTLRMGLGEPHGSRIHRIAVIDRRCGEAGPGHIGSARFARRANSLPSAGPVPARRKPLGPCSKETQGVSPAA